ncbi:MAG: 16S rRNA (cytidine(1402)-2'-O)-methyltransferase [Candidatus Acidiferrales bacterium]
MTESRAATDGIGRLYLVSTPIGNLEDITLRALRVLREVDLVACEDTRQTQKLLHHFEIEKRLVSYHEHNEITRGAELVIEMEQGSSVALASDAGTPVVSDPGHHLVTLCLRHHIPVIPIPGPSALLAALSASGLPVEEFAFLGFLPARAGNRRKSLETLRDERRTLIFYEAPHRIADMLQDAAEILGARPAVVAREITKLHEEFLRGTLAELAERVTKDPPRGEMTVLVGPFSEETAPSAAAPAALLGLSARVAQLEREEGLDRKAALKQAARERGLNKRDAYKRLLLER